MASMWWCRVHEVFTVSKTTAGAAQTLQREAHAQV
jgi:hypothetical protein